MADKEKGKEKKESHKSEGGGGAGGGLDALFWILMFFVVLLGLGAFFKNLGIDFTNLPSIAVFFELIFSKIQVFSVFLSLLFFSGTIYLSVKISELFHSAHGGSHGAHGANHDTGHKHLDIQSHGPNRKWLFIEEKMSSQNEQDWKIAIVDADIILEEMLGRMGYVGEGIAEKLKQVEKADFQTIQNAWEGHKLRNRIAHEGSNFHLSRTEAERGIENFKKVFEEFFFI
ncbi:MAG: hypothetical protein WCF92_01175 [bacterium]